MKDYQERVLIEQKELAEKIVKLNAFLTDFDKVSSLSDLEWATLNNQFEKMYEYHAVLMLRLRSFNLKD